MESLTVKELKVLAKDRGIKNYSKLKKLELIESISKYDKKQKDEEEQAYNSYLEEFALRENSNRDLTLRDMFKESLERFPFLELEILIESLEYPFSFLEGGAEFINKRAKSPSDILEHEKYVPGYPGMDLYSNTPCDIPGQITEDVGNFPNNIEKYYWIYPGSNDEEPWRLLCRLKNEDELGSSNGTYVFYKGECDYTGFDCQGSMEIYASKDPEVLIKYAMDNADYDAYVNDTE